MKLSVHVGSYRLVASSCDGFTLLGRGMQIGVHMRMSEADIQCVMLFGHNPGYAEPKLMSMQTTGFPCKREVS